MIQQFKDVLHHTQPAMTEEVKLLIAKRFADAMEFVVQNPDMIDNRYEYYLQSRVFDRLVMLEYGTRSIDNASTTLKALLDVAFEIKTLAKLQARRAMVSS